MTNLKQSVASICLGLPLAFGALTLSAAPVAAEGVVNLFHRSAAEPMRKPRMAMWNYCADKLDIEIIENYSPPKQYEVQLPVQLSSSTPPDIYAYWAGGRSQFQAATGKIRAMNDVWDNIKDNFPEGVQATSTEPDGNIYTIPTNFQPNVVWYNKRVFAEHNLSIPQTYDELLDVAATLKEAGVTPFLLGSKSGWEPLLWFDYFVLRVAGSDFRTGLMAGTESYLDPRVIEAMELWQDLLEKEYFNDRTASLGWQEMATRFISGEGAMEIMGTWTVGNFISGGMEPGTDFDVFEFPQIKEGIEMAVEGVVEGWAASGAGENTENAVAMLQCITEREPQELFSRQAQRMAANKDVPVEIYEPASFQPTIEKFHDMLESPFHQNLEMATHPGVTEVAKRELPRFLAYPDQYMTVLEQLENRRKDVFGDN
ncbi:ABC transporter substrate-binding protein [Thalassospira alkalitolerans]|uniref:ABC transporter substrate-binding protein n=1 Tax=Thalassospira alkalitolerans TaxID=1293890 RepID=UPI003AA95916